MRVKGRPTAFIIISSSLEATMAERHQEILRYLAYILNINSVFGLSCEESSTATNAHIVQLVYELVVVAITLATFIDSWWDITIDPAPFQTLESIVGYLFNVSFALNIALSSLFLKYKHGTIKKLLSRSRNLFRKKKTVNLCYNCSKFIFIRLTVLPMILTVSLFAIQLYSIDVYWWNEYESKETYNETTGILTIVISNKTYEANMRLHKYRWMVKTCFQMFEVMKKFVHDSLLLLMLYTVKEHVKHLRIKLPIKNKSSEVNFAQVQDWIQCQQNISR